MTNTPPLPPSGTGLLALASTEPADADEARMRADFTRFVGLRADARQAAPHESTELDEHATAIEDTWIGGTLAPEWLYLAGAHMDWREMFDESSELLALMEHARTGCGISPLTDTQWRSQWQARALTSPTRAGRGAWVVHEISWWQWVLSDVLRLRFPRSLCGESLEGKPGQPDPGEYGAPPCARCAEHHRTPGQGRESAGAGSSGKNSEKRRKECAQLLDGQQVNSLDC